MAIVNHWFRLDSDRIKRLENAGVHSLRDLAKVLAALDMGAKVELEAVTIPPKAEPECEAQP